MVVVLKDPCSKMRRYVPEAYNRQGSTKLRDRPSAELFEALVPPDRESVIVTA